MKTCQLFVVMKPSDITWRHSRGLYADIRSGRGTDLCVVDWNEHIMFVETTIHKIKNCYVHTFLRQKTSQLIEVSGAQVAEFLVAA